MRRIGLDLAFRAPHRAAVFDGSEPVGRPFRVERTKAGFDELERRATADVAGPCEVIMEPTGLAWLTVAAEMARRGHRIYVPKIQKTAALRKFYSTFTKSDSIDAQAQALVRHVDPKGVHELRVPTAAETSLRLFVRQRARLASEATKSKNRIHGWLVLANGHLSEAFGGEMFSRVGKAFLERFVDPFEVRARGKDQLRRFWQRKMHGRFNERLFEAVWHACELSCELYDELRGAGALPFDYAVMQQLVEQELARLAFFEQRLSALDQTIAELYAKLDPERLLEREVPGIGAVIAAAVEAFVGDVERFDNLKSFAAYFGMVPRTKQTGEKDKPRQRMTKGGPNLLKKYLFLAAEVARRADPELALTYEGASPRANITSSPSSSSRTSWCAASTRCSSSAPRRIARGAKDQPPLTRPSCTTASFGPTTARRCHVSKHARTSTNAFRPSASARPTATRSKRKRRRPRPRSIRGRPRTPPQGALPTPRSIRYPITQRVERLRKRCVQALDLKSEFRP